jgi:hypothetical protein
MFALLSYQKHNFIRFSFYEIPLKIEKYALPSQFLLQLWGTNRADRLETVDQPAILRPLRNKPHAR